MNAYMNIQVRVLSASAAAQIKALQAQINGLGGTMSKTSAMGGIVGARQIAGLTKFGNQLQWTGRQLEYNFTLPIATAGIAAGKFALDNEKAFTKIAKVYGDASLSASTMSNELNSLKGAFEALSDAYGVQQKDVLDIAADWAAAGSSGLALARGVEETLKVMVLGEMNATDATAALISIQAQYNLSSAELVDTIAKLNVVENQTAISMQGLIQGFQRSAGVARSAGVDVDHLAAFLAALVPAAGSAAQAGNALKTILSRIMSPTKKAAAVMKDMGININSMAWVSANGSQRIEILSQKFHGLADSQKTTVATTIASQYQLNKFEILMDQVYKGLNNNTKGQSRYATALDATANRSKYLAQAEKELDAVLTSNPQKLQQIWVILQNAMADIIVPLIPVILMAANMLRKMVEAFRDLPPEVQKGVTMLLLFLALFGPLLRYLGSTMALIGEVSWFFGGLASKIGMAVFWLLKFLALPLGAAGTALGAVAGFAGRFALSVLGMARAIGAFLLTGPLMGRGLATIAAIVSRIGGTIAALWMTALARMAAATGPMLSAITGLFGLWQSGMITVMTLVRNAVLGGWLSIVASAKFVGPAILGSFRTMWTAMIAMSTVGASAVVTRFRAMATLSLAAMANWRVLLVRIVSLAWTSVIALFRGALLQVGRTMLAGLATLVGPVGITIAAILAVLYIFRDQIGQVIKNAIQFFQHLPPGVAAAFKPIVDVFHAAVAAVQRGFNALPMGVKNALIAVVNVVAAAAHQVYELFSYLNPFAHHSPSLVENVTNGMAIVKKEISSITSVEGSIKSAYKEIKAFGDATKNLLQGMDTAQRAGQRTDLAKVDPKALPQFDALVKRIMSLTVQLNALNNAMQIQQAIVDKWKASLDAANAKLDAEQKKLDALNKTLDVAKDHLSAAQDALSTFANTPIQGLKAMEDQIFANDQAQKALQLQMLKMEDVGQTYDDLNGKMQALQGQIELLSGEQKSLRDAGAGSEILGVYDDQLKSLGDQTKAVQKQENQYNDLQAQLDKLAHTAQELDLEKSLNFDGLQREIDDASNSMKEMPFDDIMKGIQGANADISKYTDEVNKANDAVANQQAVVDKATAARDAIQASYDAESKKLDTLKAAYDDVNQAIQDINSSLSDMASAASDALQRAKDAASAGSSLGKAGDFPDVAGSGSLGREGGSADQSKLIDDFTKDLATKTGDLLGGFDLFGPIKKKFSALKGWFGKNVGPVFGAIGTGIEAIFGGIDWAAPFKKIDWSFLSEMWGTIKDIWKTGVGWIADIIKLFKDDAIKIWNAIKDAAVKAWKDIGPQITQFKDLLKPLADLFQELWTVIKPIAAIVGGVLLLALKIVSSVLANVLGPVLTLIVNLLKGLIQVFRGVIEFLLGVFTGNWSLAWKGIVDIFKGVWTLIWGIIKGAGEIIWGLVKGIVEGIVGFFKWLFDVLVGHSIIPDLINAIVDWIKSLPQKAWDALKDLGNKLIDIAKSAFKLFMDGLKAGWDLANKFFGGLPQKAWDALQALGGKLKDKAKAALNDFLTGAKIIWDTISAWFGGWKDRIGDKISNIAGSLKQKARDILSQFKAGLDIEWTTITNFFGGWYNRIKSMIGNVNLKEIGKAILNSLLDGLKAAWENTKAFLSGLGSEIKNLKGPIEKDRKLLVPEGGAIMNSLQVGLEGEWPGVKSYLKGVSPAIQDAINAGVTATTPDLLKGMAADQLAATANAASSRLTTTAPNTAPTQTMQYGNHYELNFYGDLSFPNVSDGNDAEEFLLNLEALVKG